MLAIPAKLVLAATGGEITGNASCADTGRRREGRGAGHTQGAGRWILGSVEPMKIEERARRRRHLPCRAFHRPVKLQAVSSRGSRFERDREEFAHVTVLTGCPSASRMSLIS